MKKLQLVLLFGVLLFYCQSFSQKSNTESILGCWKFKKIEFFEESEFNYQSNIEAKNTVVCFDENGTFTNKKIGVDEVISGSYSLSADGKTLFQKSDADEFESDTDATIKKLDANFLVLETEFGILYFDREKTN